MPIADEGTREVDVRFWEEMRGNCMARSAWMRSLRIRWIRRAARSKAFEIPKMSLASPSEALPVGRLTTTHNQWVLFPYMRTLVRR